MRNPHLRNMILAALFAALTAVVAQFRIILPAVPTVPLTLQVLVVFLAGGLLGPAWGAAAMGVYVLLGVAGLPVYAGGTAGLEVLLGPTGGYLFSYPVAAAAIGLLAPAHRGPGVWRVGAAMLAGLGVIYLGGAGWAIVLGGKAFAAVANGWVLPFIPFDLAKLALAASLSAAVNRALVAQGYWGRSAA
jgi:biotin transport system substrate-specific component